MFYIAILVADFVVVMATAVSLSNFDIRGFMENNGSNINISDSFHHDVIIGDELPWGLLEMKGIRAEKGLSLAYSFELDLESYYHRVIAVWSNGQLSAVGSLDHCQGVISCRGMVSLPDGIMDGEHTMVVLVKFTQDEEYEVLLLQQLRISEKATESLTTDHPELVIVAPVTSNWFAGVNGTKVVQWGLISKFDYDYCERYHVHVKLKGSVFHTFQMYRVEDSDEQEIALDIDLPFGSAPIEFLVIDCNNKELLRLQQGAVLSRCFHDDNLPASPGDDPNILAQCYGIPKPFLYDRISMQGESSNHQQQQHCVDDIELLGGVSIQVNSVLLQGAYDGYIKSFYTTTPSKSMFSTNMFDADDLPLFVGNITFFWDVRNSTVSNIALAFFLNTNFQAQHRLDLPLLSSENGTTTYGGKQIPMLAEFSGIAVGPNIFAFELLDCSEEHSGQIIQQDLNFVSDSNSLQTRIATTPAVLVGYSISLPVAKIVVHVDPAVMNETRTSSSPYSPFIIPRPFTTMSPNGATNSLKIDIFCLDESDNALFGTTSIFLSDLGPNGMCDQKRYEVHDHCKVWLEYSALSRVSSLNEERIARNYHGTCVQQQGNARRTKDPPKPWLNINFIGGYASGEYEKWVVQGQDFKEFRPFRDLEYDRYYFQPYQIVTMTAPCYITHPGLVFNDELVFNLDGPFYLPPLPKMMKTVHQIDDVVVIAHAFTENIYHFIIESLPRLLLLPRDVYMDKNIVVTAGSSYVYEILLAMGLKETQIVPLDKFHSLFVPHRTILPETPRAYRPTTFDMTLVKNVLWDSFGFSTQNNNNKKKIGVLISRKGEATRDVTNEMFFLQGLNMTFPSLQWMLFNPSLHTPIVASAAQVFFDAEMVVGVHGAALTNVLFMRPGTTLVELLPGRPPDFACFARLAAQMDVKYFGYFVGHFRSTPAFEIDVEDIITQLDYGINEYYNSFQLDE